MSHYTLAVITDSIEKLENMLASYDENLEVAPYIDKTKEELIKIGRKRKERVLKKKQEGEELDSWDLRYFNANTDEELYQEVIYEDETYDEERKSFNYI